MTTPCKDCSDFMPFTPNPCMNDKCIIKIQMNILLKLSDKLAEWYSKCDEYCTSEMKEFEREIDGILTVNPKNIS